MEEQEKKLKSLLPPTDHSVASTNGATPSQNFKLVTVLPLDRNISLTYFTARNVREGSLVTVPLANARVHAIVTAIENLQMDKDKLEIKNASVSFKKITTVHDEIAFTQEFFPAAKQTARFFGLRSEEILWFFVHNAPLKAAFENTLKEKETPREKSSSASEEKLPVEKRRGKFVFQSDEEERYAAYKTLIREEFAAGHSVALCLPTAQEVARATPLISKGIEEFVFTLHGKLGTKKAAAAWSGALKKEHPVAILATPHFMSLPRADISTFIVEKELSPHYRVGEPPFDMRLFMEYYARALGVRLIFGDTLLSTKALYQREEGKLDEFAPLKFHSLSSAEQTLVSMKKKEETEISPRTERGVWRAVGDELARLIADAEQTSERFFLLCGRKGLAPLTVCQDCALTVKCVHCGAPLTLHKTEEGNQSVPKRSFSCHKCGTRYPSRDTCDACGSWRLITLGIGTEGVEEELRNRFPLRTVLRFDEEIAGRAREKKKIMDAFADSQHGILVGTGAAVSHIEPRIANVAVVSVDALLSLPDFHAGERLFSSLIDLRSKALRHFFIQTRLPDNPLWKHLLSGDLLNFYRDELAGRKLFRLPPFSVLIKISYTNTEEKAREATTWLARVLEAEKPLVYPSFSETTRGSFTMHALMKIDSNRWPDDTMVHKLLELPDDFDVRVDPESIL